MLFRPNYLTQIIITSLCLLSLKFNLSYCILLQPPQTLTQQEIENLENENIKNGWGQFF